MEKFMGVIRGSAVFAGMSEDEIKRIEGCLVPRIADYPKNSYVLRAGEPAPSVCLVLSGAVHVVQEDFWGNRNIMAKIGPSDIFGESYACVRGAVLAVGVVAVEPAKIMFLDAGRITRTCQSACSFHARLISNLLTVLAEKNLTLNAKFMHITQRSTRDKLLSYLSAEAADHKSSSFEIPFNRQQLADYLSVDRSAMSNELCKLRDEGVLRFDKNKFELLA